MFRYIGSKATTAQNILGMVDQMPKVRTVADAFGGLGTVGSVLKSAGYQVSSCDALAFPHAFQVARIECNVQPRFQRLRNDVGIKNIDGLAKFVVSKSDPGSWFVREYCIQRKFFSLENGEIIAGAWRSIRTWNEAGLLSRLELAYLLASFLNSMDAVANTAGTYYAYLKNMHRKAKRPFHFNWLPITKGNLNCSSWHGDALATLGGNSFDLLYLDPPYNKRNYESYYHLPETLAYLTEREIISTSSSGLPTDRHPGREFIRMGSELSYLQSLIESIKWRNLIVHYCDQAYIPLSVLRTSLSHYGVLTEHHVNALGYTTSKTTRKILHHVFVITRPS